MSESFEIIMITWVVGGLVMNKEGDIASKI